MTEDEAKQVIRNCGWTPRTRQDRKGTKWYLYAYQKRKGKVTEKYIAPIEGLERMTEETIVSKLL